MDDHRPAWSAVGAGVMLMGWGSLIGWAIAADNNPDPNAGVPVGFGLLFLAVGFVGVYGMVAPLTRWPPWQARIPPVLITVRSQERVA